MKPLAEYHLKPVIGFIWQISYSLLIACYKTDYTDYIAMEMLLELLYPRNSKGVLYKHVMVSTYNV